MEDGCLPEQTSLTFGADREIPSHLLQPCEIRHFSTYWSISGEGNFAWILIKGSAVFRWLVSSVSAHIRFIACYRSICNWDDLHRLKWPTCCINFALEPSWTTGSWHPCHQFVTVTQVQKTSSPGGFWRSYFVWSNLCLFKKCAIVWWWDERLIITVNKEKENRRPYVIIFKYTDGAI